MARKIFGNPFKSITGTLSVMGASIGIVVLVGTSGVGMYIAYQNQRQAIAKQQLLVSQNASNQVKAFVQDKLNILTTTSKLDYVTGIPKGDKLTVLEQVLSINPAFSRIALLDTQQKQVAIAAKLSNPNSDQITAQIGTANLFKAVSQGKTYISPVYIDSASSEPLVVMAVPINDVYTGFSGALVAETNLKFMWDLVAGIKIGEQGQVYVVDGQGVLIAARDTSRVLKHEDFSQYREVREFLSNHQSETSTDEHRSLDFNGQSVIAIHTALGSPDWAVIAQDPVSEAYAPIKRASALSGLVLAIGMMVAIVASIWTSRWITRPLIGLKDAALRFGEGDTNVRITQGATNEIGQLGQAFNTMAANLQASSAKLQEEHTKLEASINSLDVGFLMIDTSGGVVMNPAVRTILGSTDSTATQTWTLAQVDEKLGESIGLKEAVDEAISKQAPSEHKAVDYDSKILHIFVAPIVTGSQDTAAVLGAVVLIEDITQQRVLDRSKDEFFSIASHELRTPLTAIRGNARMILDYYEPDIKDDDMRSMLQDIHLSSVRLIEIVNDFLDVSRLEQGKMVFKTEAFAIDKIIEQVVYEMGVVLKEKNLYLNRTKYTLGELPEVWADPDKVKQIIYNLVGNAVKFTETGGVTIDVAPEKDVLKVMVSDTGRGIPADKQALLFHKFQQANDSLLTRDTTRGTGLGLYISKMFVEKMGGKLNLEKSEEGKGTTFSFTIPTANSGQQSMDSEILQVDTNTGLAITKE